MHDEFCHRAAKNLGAKARHGYDGWHDRKTKRSAYADNVRPFKSDVGGEKFCQKCTAHKSTKNLMEAHHVQLI